MFVPGESCAQPVLQVAPGWTTAVVVVLGVRRNRVEFPLPGYLIAPGRNRMVTAGQTADPDLAHII